MHWEEQVRRAIAAVGAAERRSIEMAKRSQVDDLKVIKFSKKRVAAHDEIFAELERLEPLMARFRIEELSIGPVGKASNHVMFIKREKLSNLDD